MAHRSCHTSGLEGCFPEVVPDQDLCAGQDQSRLQCGQAGQVCERISGPPAAIAE